MQSINIPEVIKNDSKLTYLYTKYYKELFENNETQQLPLIILNKIDSSEDKLDKYIYSLIYDSLFSKKDKVNQLLKEIQERDQIKRVEENYVNEIIKLKQEQELKDNEIKKELENLKYMPLEIQELYNKYPQCRFYIDEQFKNYKQAKLNLDNKLANNIINDIKKYVEQQSKYIEDEENIKKLNNQQIEERIKFINNNKHELEYKLIENDLRKKLLNEGYSDDEINLLIKMNIDRIKNEIDKSLKGEKNNLSDIYNNLGKKVNYKNLIIVGILTTILILLI